MIGANTIVEHEIARRLHRAHVAALAVDRTVSPRDLSKFCSALIDDLHRDRSAPTLAESLVERGVDRIVAMMAHRPEVLAVGVPDPRRQELLQLERQHEARAPLAPGSAAHLYPPDRGYVRLDPTVGYESISLTDLAVLVEDPYDLASMLLRLTGDAAERSDALEQKFSDVATLFGSLSPNLARTMLSRLAGAVLALDEERRAELLRRTILPGLLDGRTEGAVLRHFPDLDLAESLCLLLQLETAAPEVVASALHRLELPAERLRRVEPLIEERLHETAPVSRPRSTDARRLIAQRAQRLVRVNGSSGTSFADFAAFDLSINDEARSGMTTVRDHIAAADPCGSRLECLAHLVALEPSVTAVEPLLWRVLELLTALQREAHWAQLMAWRERYRQIASAVQDSRPEIADLIAATLRALCTCEHVSRLQELYDRDGDSRYVARALIASAGTDIVRPFVMLLDGAPSRTETRSLIDMLSEHASELAPAIQEALATCRRETAPLLVRVLGHAGPGCESVLGSQLNHLDEISVRETLRALTRIGTQQAAALVAAHMLQGPSTTRAAAEAALWRFPIKYAGKEVFHLLERPEFVRRDPATAVRLLERTAALHIEPVRSVLRRMARLRFCVWNPGLIRVGRTARVYLHR